MELKLNKKVEQYISEFKQNVKTHIDTLDLDDKTNQNLSSFIFNYSQLTLNHTDFMKRKRVVSSIPLNERCTAKKANCEQCTRRKKDECSYCGTHEKCQPHGIIDTVLEKTTFKKCEIQIKDIKGINYYIDQEENIYDTADILSNKINPTIIAKYSISPTGDYNVVFITN